MHHTIRRAAIVAGATVATLALGTGSAIAHECYIANRSDKGNEAVNNSQVWFTIDVRELVGPGSAPGTLECLTREVQKAGLPLTYTIMGKVPQSHDGVLGSKNPNMAAKAQDGKGIDHIGDERFGQYVGILFGCGGQLPPGF